MDKRRFSDPVFFVSALNFVLLLVLIFTRSPAPSSQTSISADDDNRLAAIDSRLSELEQERSNESNPDYEIPLHTTADAESLIADLGESPTSEQIAECLAELDSWVATPEDSEPLQAIKVAQVSTLRQAITRELGDLHKKAILADTGANAAEYHARASQVLALYPMDSTKAVLDEARNLSSRHSEAGVRIDVIRRQRYNAWAMTRIEETIKEVNSIASSFRTSDNPKTIEATVKSLGEIDPLLLEPVVAQLYNYAVEQAKSNVNSEQQLELGRRMIDPAIRRKGYEDF